MKVFPGILLLLVIFFAAANVSGQQASSPVRLSVKSQAGPGYVPRVIKTREERQRLRNVPIINRPYRPGHFYGNTIRRIYYGRRGGFIRQR